MDRTKTAVDSRNRRLSELRLYARLVRVLLIIDYIFQEFLKIRPSLSYLRGKVCDTNCVQRTKVGTYE